MIYSKTSELLFRTAEEMGLHPTPLTNYGVFSIQTGKKLGYVAYSHTMVNNHLSAYIVKHKYATREILQEHDFPNIPYLVTEELKDAEEFLQKHAAIILKLILGERSQDVHFITRRKQLTGFVLQNYILEKYIKGKEMRYLVMRGNVQAVHEKSYDEIIKNSATMRRISYPKEAWNQGLVTMALEITKMLYLKMAAVDFLIDEKGNAYVLEVNSAPALHYFQSPSKGPAIPIAQMFLEDFLKEIKKF